MKSLLYFAYRDVDPVFFYHTHRPRIVGYIERITFEGTGESYTGLLGSSAMQSPMIAALDIFLSANHDYDNLCTILPYLKAEHRLFMLHLYEKRAQIF